MDVRIRLPELMQAAGVATTYAFSMPSGERIPMTTAHRLLAAQGAVRYLDADMLDVRCAAFGVRRSAFGVRRSAFGVRRSGKRAADPRAATWRGSRRVEAHAQALDAEARVGASARGRAT